MDLNKRSGPWVYKPVPHYEERLTLLTEKSIKTPKETQNYHKERQSNYEETQNKAKHLEPTKRRNKLERYSKKQQKHTN